jgi:protoheme IX farnesyltransferase
MRRLVTDASGAITLEPEAPAADALETTASTQQKIAAYVALTKPRIIELLLVTTVPSMVVAAGTWPSWWLVIATLIGGTLSAGGANAINCYIDRDIDQVMARTKRRPLPMHKIAPRNALVFGSSLGVIALIWMWLLVNPLSALLTTSALLFYVFVYTLGMKRSTPQNIVIGGAAGAVPALVGWAAVTDSIELPALALFGIIFYWTPPHFWALAMRYEKEYAAAGVPMMPVVYGKAETTRHILLYSFMQLAMCLAFFSTAQMGWLYLAATVALNGTFIWMAIGLYRDPTPKKAWSLFRFSIYFLALLFASMALDTLLI